MSQGVIFCCWLLGIAPAILIVARYTRRADVTDDGAAMLGVAWPLSVFALLFYGIICGLTAIARLARRGRV